MVAKDGVWMIWILAIGLERWEGTYGSKELIVIIVVMVMTVVVIGRSQGIVVGSLRFSIRQIEMMIDRALTKKVMLMFLLSSTS